MGNVTRWAGKGTLAIIDQTFISGSNFVLNILLARWASPEEYGAFTLAFAVFLLLSQVQQSVLLEPMSVFGATYSGPRLRRYYGSLLHMQNGMLLLITIPLALAAIAASHFGHANQLGSALWGVTIASPFVMLFWMTRRAFYLEHATTPAAAGAVVYSVATCGGVILVQRTSALTSVSAFLVMAMAAMVTSAGMLWRLRPQFRRIAEDASFSAECKEHWRYGGWALAGALAMWFPQNVFYAVLTGTGGMASAGEIRALLNLALPLQRMTVALGLLLLPYAAKVHSEHGREGAKAFTRRICLLFAVGSAAYWVLVLLFGDQMFRLLYAGKYSSLRHLLPWLALSSILNAVEAALVVGLRAMRSPASVFYAYGISAVASLLIGVPATWWWGISGVVFSFIFSNIAALIASVALMSRTAKSVSEPAAVDGKFVLTTGATAFQAFPDAKAS